MFLPALLAFAHLALAAWKILFRAAALSLRLNLAAFGLSGERRLPFGGLVTSSAAICGVHCVSLVLKFAEDAGCVHQDGIIGQTWMEE